MAEVRLSEPIGALRGDLRKKGELYARMLYGKCVIQKKPRRSSEKQRAMTRARLFDKSNFVDFRF